MYLLKPKQEANHAPQHNHQQSYSSPPVPLVPKASSRAVYPVRSLLRQNSTRRREVERDPTLGDLEEAEADGEGAASSLSKGDKVVGEEVSRERRRRDI